MRLNKRRDLDGSEMSCTVRKEPRSARRHPDLGCRRLGRHASQTVELPNSLGNARPGPGCGPVPSARGGHAAKRRQRSPSRPSSRACAAAPYGSHASRPAPAQMYQQSATRGTSPAAPQRPAARRRATRHAGPSGGATVRVPQGIEQRAGPHRAMRAKRQPSAPGTLATVRVPPPGAATPPAAPQQPPSREEQKWSHLAQPGLQKQPRQLQAQVEPPTNDRGNNSGNTFSHTHDVYPPVFRHTSSMQDVLFLLCPRLL